MKKVDLLAILKDPHANPNPFLSHKGIEQFKIWCESQRSNLDDAEVLFYISKSFTEADKQDNSVLYVISTTLLLADLKYRNLYVKGNLTSRNVNVLKDLAMQGINITDEQTLDFIAIHKQPFAFADTLIRFVDAGVLDQHTLTALQKEETIDTTIPEGTLEDILQYRIGILISLDKAGFLTQENVKKVIDEIPSNCVKLVFEIIKILTNKHVFRGDMRYLTSMSSNNLETLKIFAVTI